MTFNPSGSLLVTCSANGVFEIYDTREYVSIFKVPSTGRIWEVQANIPSLAWLDDTRLAILGPETPNAVVNCWQFDESHATSPFLQFAGHEGSINDIKYDNKSGVLATASSDQTVKLWKSDKSTPYHDFRDHTGSVQAVAFQPSDTDSNLILASASFDGTVSLYDVTSLSRLYCIGNAIHSFPRDRIGCISWSPDGKFLSTGDLESVVGIWEWRNSSEPRAFAIWAPERAPDDHSEPISNGTNGHKEDLDRPVHGIHWQKNGQSFVVCRENRRVLS
jgi:WD40 repeat protein